MLRDEFKAKNIKEYPKKAQNGEEELKFYFTFETRAEAKAYHDFIKNRQNIFDRRIFLNFFYYFLQPGKLVSH